MCVSMQPYSYEQKQKLLLLERHRHVTFAILELLFTNRELYIFDKRRCFQSFIKEKPNLVNSFGVINIILIEIPPFVCGQLILARTELQVSNGLTKSRGSAPDIPFF